MAHYNVIQIKGFNGLVVEEPEALRFGKQLAREAVANERNAILAYLNDLALQPPSGDCGDLLVAIEGIKAGDHHEGTSDQSTGSTTSPSTTSSSEEA